MFSKFISGLLYGLGFSISVLIVSLATYYFWPSPESTHSQIYVETETVRNLEFSSVEIIEGENEVFISGSAKNKSRLDYSSLLIEIELFDDTSKFVAECEYMIKDSLVSGSNLNFSTSCNLPKLLTSRVISANVKVIRGSISNKKPNKVVNADK